MKMNISFLIWPHLPEASLEVGLEQAEPEFEIWATPVTPPPRP
jgi:hypothetical protein